MVKIPSWTCFSQTKPVPTRVGPVLTWPTVSLSAICVFFFFFPGPTRDSGTQLARGTNWIQSCSLQAKKWAIQPRTDGILCSVLSLPLPSAPISNPSPLLLSLCCSAVKQVKVLVEETTHQSTDWQLSGDKQTPGDSAGGIVMRSGEEKRLGMECFL